MANLQCLAHLPLGDITVSRLARRLTDAPSHVPVTIVPGSVPPRYLGRCYFYTTLSGRTIVHYPGAYRWPTVYHPSTLRVEVGADWIAQAPEYREESGGTYSPCRSLRRRHA